MDRIAIVVALTGALIRFGNFTNSEILGKPTDSNNGVVFARDVTDYLVSDASGAGWVESIDFKKNFQAENNDAGHVPIFIDIDFKKRRFEESQLRSYLDNGVNTKLSRLGKHIDEPILHNLDYKLVQMGNGSYMARISTFAIPRHPAQLYESLSTFLIYLLLFYLWSRKKKETKPGLLFGTFLILVFTLRFFHEFIKENQVPFEDAMALNMGQWLSIPMVIFGILLLVLPKPLKSDQGTGS
jgi:prolipoprotein diacylglyceryltransferase